MNTNELHVDPTQLRSAAARLDALADRMDGVYTTQAAGLAVEPSGLDEVSVRAAKTFNAVAEDFDTDGKTASHELRKIAAVLRLQAGGFSRAEQQNTETFLT